MYLFKSFVCLFGVAKTIPSNILILYSFQKTLHHQNQVRAADADKLIGTNNHHKQQ